MPDSDTQSLRKETGSALSKAVAVLSAMLQAERSLSLAEIADRLDLPRQTVHRIMGQLEDEALVRRLPGDDGYMVGPAMVDLGIDALAAAGRTAPMRAILEDLVAEVGETCNVGVLDRDRVVYIARVECDWPLRLQIGVGSRVPIHATAIGKMLLAHLPSRTRKRIVEARPLECFTEKTVTDPEVLEAQLTAIRRQGFAGNDEENMIGMMGFAVPVQDPRGRVAGGVALHAPKARMTVESAEVHLEAFRRAAGRLEAFIADLARD